MIVIASASDIRFLEKIELHPVIFYMIKNHACSLYVT